MKNNFEEIIRESLANHEVPYEAGAWEKFQSNLPASTPFYKTKWFMGGVAVLVLAGIVGYNAIPDTLNPISSSTAQASTKNQESTGTDVINVNTEITNAGIDQNINGNIETENLVNIDTTDIPMTIEESYVEVKLSPNHGNSGNDKSVTDKSSKAQLETSEPKAVSKEDKTITNKQNPTSVVTETEIKDYKNNFSLAETTCEGESIILTPEKYSSNHNYKWIVNNGLVSFKGRNVTYNPTVTGNTSVKLIVTDENGKQLTSITKNIVVNQKPEGAIQITEEDNTTYNSFVITSYNSGNSVYWNMGDGTTSSENTFTHTYKQAGIYNVEYTLTNRNGCHLTETKKIEVEGLYNIREDYGFSPNGDNLNDNFIPSELKELNVKFEMTVYSRSGQLVYTTNSVDRPWNGNLKDGSKSPFGSYVWVVTLTNEYGVSEVYKGTITNVTN